MGNGYYVASDEVVAVAGPDFSPPDIPRTVHVIWMQGWEHLERVKPHLAQNVDDMGMLMPDWHVRLWDAAACARIVRDVIPRLFPLYAAAPNYATRADIARYAILYVHGGMYVDTDLVPLASMAWLCHGASFVGAMRHDLSRPESAVMYRANNCWMACAPRHPVMWAMINLVTERSFYWMDASKASLERPRTDAMGLRFTIHCTGPEAWCALLETAARRASPAWRVRIIEGSVVDPLTLGIRRTADISEIRARFPAACAVHLSELSWVGGPNPEILNQAYAVVRDVAPVAVAVGGAAFGLGWLVGAVRRALTSRTAPKAISCAQ